MMYSSPPLSPDIYCHRKELSRFLDDVFFETLDDREVLCIWMRYYEGKDYEEIKNYLPTGSFYGGRYWAYGVSAPRARQITHKAMRKIKWRLKEKYPSGFCWEF